MEPASDRETVKTLVALARPTAQGCHSDLRHPLSCAETNAWLKWLRSEDFCMWLRSGDFVQMALGVASLKHMSYEEEGTWHVI
jgi:hypothetical protein